MNRHTHATTYIQAIIAGVLLGTSLLHSVLWPLVFLGVILALWSIDKASSAQHAVLLGLIIGAVKIALSLVWFWSTYPLVWLGLEPGVFQIFIIGLYWIPAALTLGSGIALFAYVYRTYIITCPRFWLYAVCVAFAWMASEVVGALIFSLYTLGPGSSITAAFSFGHTGYALAQYDLLFSTFGFLGVYGLSFAVGLISACIYKLYSNNVHGRGWIVLIIIAGGFIPLAFSSTPTDITVSLVQTHFQISGTSKAASFVDRKQSLKDAVAAAIAAKTQYILLPEDSRFTTYFSSPDATLHYLQSITSHPIVLVDSARYDNQGSTVLRAYVYDTQAGEVYSFDKQYLVPQGEYIPFVYKGLMSLVQPSGRTLSSLDDTTYRPGIDQSTVNLPANIPAVLFCFESVSPLGVYNATKNRSDIPFVAHVVSHAWFNREPHILWNQLHAMLRTQARMNSTPILQASNQAPLAVYLPSGKVLIPRADVEEQYWSLAVLEW